MARQSEALTNLKAACERLNIEGFRQLTEWLLNQQRDDFVLKAGGTPKPHKQHKRESAVFVAIKRQTAALSEKDRSSFIYWLMKKAHQLRGSLPGETSFSE